jgi:hypothetical protein
MLGKDEDAYHLLRTIVDASLDELLEGCPKCGPRGLQADAFFLLAIVIQYSRGDCEEALRHAEEHLKRRRRGLHSLWTIDEVRVKLATIRRGISVARSGGARPKKPKW